MNTDYALYGKHLLNRSADISAFQESVKIRFHSACKQMALDPDSINVKCFSSLSKESFIIYNKNETNVYMDNHQVDSLYMLTLLFYLYGQINFKYPFYRLIFEIIPYFNKRTDYCLLLLQAEKCFLSKKLIQARVYLDACKNYDYASYTKHITALNDLSDEQAFTLNLILLKGRQQDICIAFSLNFFVYHELAHAKYYLMKDSLSVFTNTVFQSLIASKPYIDLLFKNSNLTKPNIPIEEYVCDVYALYLLYDLIYEHYSDYETKYMIDSYSVSILNITLINSKTSDNILFSEDDYIYACFRTTIVLCALRMLWINEKRSVQLLQSIENAINDSFVRFKNFKFSLDTKWNELYSLYHINSTETLSYEEENRLTKELVRRFEEVE